MSNNNNKQPLDPTESLPVFNKAQAPSTTTPTVNKLDYVGISLVSDVKPGEKNDTLDIPEINQPDVTTRNLSHSDELTIGILLDCVKRGQNRGNQRAPFICKVPRVLRDHSESSFEPQLVSIGPIHREDPKLKEFEWVKECYLYDLLDRFFYFRPKKTLLEAFLLEVNDLIPQIRESYTGVKKNYSDDDLARMMVMDGCFILEFCFKHDEENLLPNKMQNLRIAMDLILLENQVPFVVLKALFYCMAPYIESVTLRQVLDKYLAPYIQLFYSEGREKSPTTDASCTDDDSDSTHDHVLGYLHRRYQLLAAKSSNREERIENTANHSIVELDRSGMKFKPHQENEWSMTIKFQISLLSCLPWFWVCCCCCCCCCCFLFPCLTWFWIKPTLRMPALLIDDITELILRNFIAYEQSFPHDCYYFTSYAHAMDKLINTQEDIAKLAESKVLYNMLGTNQEAADMINKICRNISITDFYYYQEFKQMDEYYSGYFRDHIAQLRRVYFSNPWSIIALVGAIIVSLATVVATIFAVLDYYR